MNQPEIITETDDYFVLAKPAHMAVEPPSKQETLLDWLIRSKKIVPGDWEPTSRYGVVHRLDSDTSGVMIWAKNPDSQQKLKQLWQGRAVKKTYLALVAGECQLTGTIELPLIRDNRKDRQTVAWLNDQGARAAITEYERIAVGRAGSLPCSLVKARPITGRTHQIRVHFKAIGHPIVGDKLYGEKLSNELAKRLKINRQFLHALRLCLPNQDCYSAKLPDELIESLNMAGINQIE
jgi:23S rRNA pseudouridine1911/1915/1917 synthase